MKILLILEEHFNFPHSYYIMWIIKINGEIYEEEDNKLYHKNILDICYR